MNNRTPAAHWCSAHSPLTRSLCHSARRRRRYAFAPNSIQQALRTCEYETVLFSALRPEEDLKPKVELWNGNAEDDGDDDKDGDDGDKEGDEFEYSDDEDDPADAAMDVDEEDYMWEQLGEPALER